jgi:hypothetical protein
MTTQKKPPTIEQLINWFQQINYITTGAELMGLFPELDEKKLLIMLDITLKMNFRD